MPYGPHVKVHNKSDAHILAKKFQYLAKKFKVTLQVYVHETTEPAGRGVGPLLETRESLKVLEQKEDRPLDLEEKALILAGMLLDLCLKDASKKIQEQVKSEFGNGSKWAAYILSSGHALKKMREIIKAQGGDSDIISDRLKAGEHVFDIHADERAVVKEINSANVTIIAKILGAPAQKKSGLYLHKKIGEIIKPGDVIITLYSESKRNLAEAKDSLVNFSMLTYI